MIYKKQDINYTTNFIELPMDQSLLPLTEFIRYDRCLWTMAEL